VADPDPDPDPSPSTVVLRDVTADDLPIFFEHQRHADSNRMAAVGARDHDAFFAHWATVLADPTNMTQTVLADGVVAGNVVSFERDGERLVGYWIGSDFWGRGVATRAVAQFLAIETTRPLHARVAQHNVGSRRVLEKCGFVLVGEGVLPPETTGGEPIDEFLFSLEA
jgi:RimJ/RimL family protein N-acetyltransferase